MNEVVIKKYKDGLTVLLNPDIPFESLYTALGRKFRESANFFGQAKLVISFEGRELDPYEERLLVDAISDNTELSILHIMGNDDDRNSQYYKAGSRFLGKGGDNQARYYKGTVKAGEILEADTDIIILGDVNPGGEVVSSGNIIVFGTLYGTAKAGSKGDDGHFIIALELKPIRVAIGETYTTRFGRRSHFRAKAAPKIVYLREGELMIDEITPEGIESLPIGGLSEMPKKQKEKEED